MYIYECNLWRWVGIGGCTFYTYYYAVLYISIQWMMMNGIYTHTQMKIVDKKNYIFTVTYKAEVYF